jgi:hypothetical protein
MAVALAASLNVNSATNAQNQTITTASFTPATGEIIVFKAVGEDQQLGFTATPTASGGGITWIKRAENNIVGQTRCCLWTGTVTAGGSAITISLTSTNSFSGYFSIVVERWTGAQIANSPSMVQSNGSGAPTGSLNVVGTGSSVSYLCGDWNAASGTAAYTGGATQDGIHTVAATYSAYYATQTASAGPVTVGMSAPSPQTYSIIAIEIQATGQANPVAGRMMMTGAGI